MSGSPLAAINSSALDIIHVHGISLIAHSIQLCTVTLNSIGFYARLKVQLSLCDPGTRTEVTYRGQCVMKLVLSSNSTTPTLQTWQTSGLKDHV